MNPTAGARAVGSSGLTLFVANVCDAARGMLYISVRNYYNVEVPPSTLHSPIPPPLPRSSPNPPTLPSAPEMVLGEARGGHECGGRTFT